MGTVVNTYLGLRILIVLRLITRRKLSLLKIWNYLVCYSCYFFRRTISGKSPIVINFELWNECNESCVFCRDENDDIFDLNPNGLGAPIPKGKLNHETYLEILDSFRDRLILSIPYINGEPLLSKDIYKTIQAASDRNIGTLIASNGILLNQTNSQKLLEADLDCLKVHISGFTDSIHTIEHRKGDVERIKRNLVQFMQLRKKMNAKTIVMLDFIGYKHNAHEIEQARYFAKRYGMLFSIRPGNPKGMETTESVQSNTPLPQKEHCVWLWAVLTVDWNGAVYPCCDHVVWSGADAYGMADQVNLNALWKGPEIQKMRQIHATEGRLPIPICAQCPRQGVKFKW